MAKLKSFTLDGEAIRLIGYKDQKGQDLYELHLAEAFNRRGLTREQVMGFVVLILNDVTFDGMLNVQDGKFTHPLLKAFIGEGEDDQQEDGA